MQQKSTFQFILPYAIALFGIRLAIDTIIKQFHLGYLGEYYGGLIALFIELGIVFLATYKYKTWLNGEMKFAEGVKIGLGLMLILGILFSAYLFIHNEFIDPTYQKRIAEIANEKLQSQNPNSQLIMKPNAKEPNVLAGYGISIMRFIFIGVFGGILSAAILKTEK